MKRFEALELVRKVLMEEGHIEEDEAETVQEGRVLLEMESGHGLIGEKLDSLDLVEFVMGIEEEVGIEVDDEDFEKWLTVGDVVDFLERVT